MANRAAPLFAHAQRWPDRQALHFEGSTYSFADLAERASAIAGGLARLGIRQGVHVGLLLPTSYDFIAVQQALFVLGAVITPLNTQYRPEEVRHAIGCCDLTHIVTTEECASALASISHIVNGACSIIAVDAPADDDSIRSLSGATGTSPPIHTLTEVAPNDPVMQLLTSATTGKAKGVILTAGNLAANYDRTPGWLGMNEDSVILCALPLYNTFGLNQCINAMLVTGAMLVLLPKFDAGRCIAAIAERGCTFLPAVPTMLQKILDHPDAARHSLSSLTHIMTGGAPVPSVMLRRLKEVAPDTTLLTGYGLTEATALVTLTEICLGPDGELERGRTIGRVLDGMDLRIADDDGRPVPPHAIGEILVRGPNIMAGYYHAREDTTAALRNGWLHTGDIGYLDEDGYAFIVDRKKDVIIRGGQNIYPADIEEILYHCPGIAEAAVVGIPDDLLGEVPVAFISLRPGAECNIAAIMEHCRASLAHYKLPVAIHVQDQLPKGPTGKILRRALRPGKIAA